MKVHFVRSAVQADNMDDRGGSFVAVRRISQGTERGSTCHSTSGDLPTCSCRFSPFLSMDVIILNASVYVSGRIN